MNNNLNWEGIIYIKIFNKITGQIKRFKIKNLITNLGFDEIIKSFYTSAPDMQIKEFAIGTGTTSPAASDTKLSNEIYRISDSTIERSGTGQVTSEFILKGSEYTGAIEELGIFCGSLAQTWSSGAGKDTGLLLARVLWSYTLTVDEEIYFRRVDTIS